MLITVINGSLYGPYTPITLSSNSRGGRVVNNWIGLVDDVCVRTVLMLGPDDDARNFQCNEKTNAVRADFFKPNGSVQRRTYTQSKSGKWNLEFKVLPKPPPVVEGK